MHSSLSGPRQFLQDRNLRTKGYGPYTGRRRTPYTRAHDELATPLTSADNQDDRGGNY